MFNKHNFNEKKLLHKIGKHWCVISIAVLGIVGGIGACQTHVSAMSVALPKDAKVVGSSGPITYYTSHYDNITSKINAYNEEQRKQSEQANYINSAKTSAFDASMAANNSESASNSSEYQSNLTEDRLSESAQSESAERSEASSVASVSVSTANSELAAARSDATRSNASDSSIASDSSVVDYDENQILSNDDQLNSLEDTLLSDGVDDANEIVTSGAEYFPQSTVDSANYIMGRVYSDDLKGYASEDGYTHSDDVSMAGSLKSVANSATSANNSYVASLSNLADSLSDPANDEDSNDYDSEPDSNSDDIDNTSLAPKKVARKPVTHKRHSKRVKSQVKKKKSRRRSPIHHVKHRRWHRGTPKALGRNGAWLGSYKRVRPFKFGHKVIRYERAVSATLGGNHGFNAIWVNFNRSHHYVNNGNDLSYNMDQNPNYKDLGHRRYEIVCGGTHAHPIAKAQVKMIVKIYNHNHIYISHLGEYNGHYHRINFKHYMRKFWGNAW